ncbi:MAG: DinB family protein [Ginsengibacter sp.]
MTKDNLNTSELFFSLEQTLSGLLQLIFSADAVTLNTICFKDSWTGGQLVFHVIKSNKAITQSLYMEGKIAERDPGERVNELKTMFLDFTIKFNSPEFIFPREDAYQKETLVTDLKKSIDNLKEKGSTVNLSEIITLPAFGEITKYELLHFVLYHTQRHIYQLKNILQNVKNKELNN